MKDGRGSMIHYLKCFKRSHRTGRLLATAITEIQGQKCVYCNKDIPARPELRHIRWGSIFPTSDNGINLLSGVRIASNKLMALVRLQSAGVLVPTLFMTNEFESTSNVRRIFRKSSRQDANDDPYFVAANELPDPSIAAEYDYALEHIASDREYRVDIFDGQPIKIREKTPIQGLEPSGDVRSSSRGWTTEILKGSPCAGLVETAAKAVSFLGLHFGAVDIVEGRDNRLFVLEVNTAPGMGADGSMLYAIKFVEWDRATPDPGAQ
ncbi:MAG: hypothetical protein JWM11_1077 [Planctomycetaceae bacterium]|nr:hypothetical protein [Planctomycetaceae bacterium]